MLDNIIAKKSSSLLGAEGAGSGCGLWVHSSEYRLMYTTCIATITCPKMLTVSWPSNSPLHSFLTVPPPMHRPFFLSFTVKKNSEHIKHRQWVIFSNWCSTCTCSLTLYSTRTHVGGTLQLMTTILYMSVMHVNFSSATSIIITTVIIQFNSYLNRSNWGKLAWYRSM